MGHVWNSQKINRYRRSVPYNERKRTSEKMHTHTQTRCTYNECKRNRDRHLFELPTRMSLCACVRTFFYSLHGADLLCFYILRKLVWFKRLSLNKEYSRLLITCLNYYRIFSSHIFKGLLSTWFVFLTAGSKEQAFYFERRGLR